MEEEVGGVSACRFVLLLEHVVCFFSALMSRKGQNFGQEMCFKGLILPKSKKFSGRQRHLRLVSHI